MPTTTTPRIRYETETCRRCAGSGRYSYNSMTGDTCFACSGKRETLTARAARARDEVTRLMRTAHRVPASTIKAGDVIITPRGQRAVVTAVDTHGGERLTLQTDGIGFGVTTTDLVRLPLTPAHFTQLIEAARGMPGVTIV